MNRRTILVPSFFALAVIGAALMTGCATETDEPEEEQGSTESEVKKSNIATPDKDCCAICMYRAKGVAVASYAGVKASGLTCNQLAKNFCNEPGKGRGGLYDAQWGKTCGQ